MSKILLLVSLISFTACGKGKSGEGGGGGKPKATDLPDLGLVVDVAEGAALSDMSMGGEKTTMVRTDDTVFSVAVAKPDKKFEEVLEDTKLYNGVKVTKQDKTADGWHVEWNNKGGAGDVYSLHMRRTIGGKPFDCTTSAADAGQRTRAVTACGTLRAK